MESYSVDTGMTPRNISHPYDENHAITKHREYAKAGYKIVITILIPGLWNRETSNSHAEKPMQTDLPITLRQQAAVTYRQPELRLYIHPFSRFAHRRSAQLSWPAYPLLSKDHS